MKTNLFITMTATALLLASCSNDEHESTNPNGLVEARITAGLNTTTTRAVDNQWTGDEKIGVMVTKIESEDQSSKEMLEIYKNVQYKVDGADGAGGAGSVSINPVGAPIYFLGTSKVTFAAYAPYQNNLADGGIIIGSTVSQTEENQESIDYLYASGATASKAEPSVDFTGQQAFKHVMSRLIIKVKTGEGFNIGDVNGFSYTLGGLKHDGTFDVTEGVAEANGDANVNDNWNIGNCPKEYDSKTDLLTFTIILYPQDLNGAAENIEGPGDSEKPGIPFTVTIGDQHYSTNILSGRDLVAGNSYTYNIEVKKIGLVITGNEITGWETAVENGQGTVEVI